MEVKGTVAPGFGAVRDAFAAGQEADPGGAQLCVYRHGEVVVDLWAGRDQVADRPYSAELITVLMSCTKALTAICALMLAERGLIDLEAPVAEVWPEFTQNGKGHISLAQVLSHTAGLAAFDPDAGITARDELDFDKGVQALAAMAPLWPPGSGSIYHFVTYGFLVGEVVRRASGKSLGRFFADEIGGPLGLDLWIGLPSAQEKRVAQHVRSRVTFTTEQWVGLLRNAGLDPEDRLVRALIGAFTTTDELIELMKAPEAHAAELPAGNGIGNARSLARVYAAAIGEVDGTRLLQSRTVSLARAPRTDHLPPVLKLPWGAGDRQRFGLGFELDRPTVKMLGEGSFGHPGAGGRLAFAHPEKGYAAAYVCTSMTWDDMNPDPRWAWSDALREIADR